MRITEMERIEKRVVEIEEILNEQDPMIEFLKSITFADAEGKTVLDDDGIPLSFWNEADGV